MFLPEFLFERVASEIRDQMDGVLALTERLGRQHLSADAQACVSGVAEAVIGVRDLIDAGLTLKSATGELELSPEPRTLSEIVDGLIGRWEPRAARSGLTLLAAYDGPPEAVGLVDARRVAQVFDGFLGVALATLRRGAVEASLHVEPCDGGFRVEGRVRGGGGLEACAVEADCHALADRLGLEAALGLALARRLVERMDGSLAAEANAGAGETVVFALVCPAAEAQDETPAVDASTAKAAHILVVDDNATNRMVAETLCDMFDCTSEPACDGVEAVELARTGRFDLILMDIKMPRMDGVAAARAIRAVPGRVGRTPIIALTANADPEDAKAYLAAGMNGVVEKPMKPENLLRALQEALDPGEPAAA